MDEARTAITVALISLGGTFITVAGAIIVWILSRRAEVADRRNAKKSEYIARIDALEKNQIAMGNAINEQGKIQKMIVDGVSYIVDGLEGKKILNGTGKEYLRQINKYYEQKGYDALQFHSLESTARKKTGTED